MDGPLLYNPKPRYIFLIFQASTSRAGKSMNDEAVFIKKFPRYEDVFCLGVEEKSRSLKMDNALPVNMTNTDVYTTDGGNNLENFQRSEKTDTDLTPALQALRSFLVQAYFSVLFWYPYLT